MIAKLIKDILPLLFKEQIHFIVKHQFLNGIRPDLSALHTIRFLHYTETSATIFGGDSSVAKIREVALARKGILY